MKAKKYLALYLCMQIALSTSSYAFAAKTRIDETINVESLLESSIDSGNECFDIDISKENEALEEFDFNIINENGLQADEEKIELEIEKSDSISLEKTSMHLDGISTEISEPMMLRSSSVMMLSSAPSSETKKTSKQFVYGYNSRGVLGGIQDAAQSLIFQFKHDNNGNLIKIFE